MKEMLHHLKVLIAEASSKKGEARFANVQSSSIVQPLSFLDEANKVLRTSQTEKQKEVMLEKKQETFGKMSEMMEDSTLSVKYEKKPSTIVEISQVLLDILKGTSSAVYHLGKDFVLGTIQMLEDIPGTLEAIGSMIARPIDTVKYIGNVVIDSFNHDVIHGDTESRAHWFTYAIGSIFGTKGLGNVGKAGATAAKKGAQKTGQRLDELLPYHPKHQLAIDGPVPYNVYDGNFFKEQLMVRAENISRQEKGLRSKDKSSGKGTGDVDWNMSKDGWKINGREYSQHSLERMAPDTLKVKATLTRRAIKKAEELGYKPQTKEFSDFIKKYVEPRNIPPSVVEDAIKNTKKIPGKRTGTFIHETQDVKVIINEVGDVITVISK